MNELALFAGAGGGILGGVLLGWTCVGACEIERHPREVLLARQRDGILPKFPIWDDVRTFDGKPWRGLVDIITGGFPCQDISAAGKGAGINGERSGLWAEMHRIIREVRPRFAYLENSPMLVSRGLGRVLGDLAEIGYNAVWTCLSAADCGAPHKRERIWILAMQAHDTDTDMLQRAECGEQHERSEIIAHRCTDRMAPGGEVDNPDGQGRRPKQLEAGELEAALEKAPRQQPCGAGGHEGNIPNSNQLRRRTPPATGNIQAEQPHALRVRGASSGGEVPDTNGAGQQAPQQSRADEAAQPAVERGCHVPDSASGGQQIRLQCKEGEHRGAQGKAPDVPSPCGATGRAGKKPSGNTWWSVEPRLGRVVDGVAHRVDRLKALGNGQVPIVAATAFRILYRQLTNQEYQP